MSAEPYGVKVSSKVIDWLDSWKQSARVGVQTFKVYRAAASGRGNCNRDKEEAEDVGRIAAASVHLQVICWPCLEAFNERSQLGEDPDYSPAFGHVSIAQEIQRNLPMCHSCGKAMSLVGTTSQPDRNNEYHDFCQVQLAEAMKGVRSSLAFRAARTIATLSRKHSSGS